MCKRMNSVICIRISKLYNHDKSQKYTVDVYKTFPNLFKLNYFIQNEKSNVGRPHMVEHLPSKHEARSSKSSTTPKDEKSKKRMLSRWGSKTRGSNLYCSSKIEM
jgi:hypothetical protein